MGIRNRAPRRPDAHPHWLGRLRARARDSRGVAVVEAAFVTPVFFILILGIIEGGLYMQDYLAVSNAVRAGARSASAGGALALTDLYTVYDISNESAALPRNQIQYVVIYKASGYGSGPTGTGAGINGGCKGGVPEAGVCNVYRPDDMVKAAAQIKEISDQEAAVAAGQTRTFDQTKVWFGCATTGPNANVSLDRYWCPGVRKDARSDNSSTGPDYVGVYMKVNHNWVTKMFGSTRTITDQSVIQIEPRSE